MKKDRICPHCNTFFPNEEGRIFSNHVRWCKFNPKHDELCGLHLIQKIRHCNEQRQIKLKGRIKEFDVVCDRCGKHFLIKEREKLFPSKERYFCSSKCRHGYSGSKANPKNISLGRKRFDAMNPGYWAKDKKPTIYETRNCEWCGMEFVTSNRKNKRCCSQSCAAKNREFVAYHRKFELCKTDIERIKIEFLKYQKECKFSFSLNQYPDEFDFSLIESNGWYAAKNHGDNPNGVSRDHMYSIKDGFINRVDPKIISHPANCRLILQRENASKYSSSCITLDELMRRIEYWDAKYGKISDGSVRTVQSQNQTNKQSV